MLLAGLLSWLLGHLAGLRLLRVGCRGLLLLLLELALVERVGWLLKGSSLLRWLLVHGNTSLHHEWRRHLEPLSWHHANRNGDSTRGWRCHLSRTRSHHTRWSLHPHLLRPLLLLHHILLLNLLLMHLLLLLLLLLHPQLLLLLHSHREAWLLLLLHHLRSHLWMWHLLLLNNLLLRMRLLWH